MSEASAAILAIHDEPGREALRGLLRSVGLSVWETATEPAILEAAASERAAMILMDADLLGQDGVDLCRRIKVDPACLAPVVLRVPASVSDSRRRSAFAAEADAWLAEPLDPDAAVATLRSMLRLSQQRRDLAESTRLLHGLEAQLQSARADLELFASQACHDAEEPLRGFAMFAELIEARTDGRLSDDDRTYLGYVLAAGNRFRRLLRSVLLYSRAGRVEPKDFAPVNMRIVLAAAMQTQRQLIEQAKAEVEIEEPLPHLPGDFGELQQVFEHLIANAVVYCRHGLAPAVTIGARPGRRDESVIWIADNGPGVPEDRRDVVLQPFKRLHGRDLPGAGMGLAIAKRIVEAHGGRIWIEPGPVRGARVCVALPSLQAEK